MILSKRAEVDRFLDHPPAGVRAAVIHGRDRGGVRERADRLASRLVPRPDDPFDVAVLTETDLDGDPAKLADELSAQSLMGGRRLVRLRLGEKAAVERACAETLKSHLEGLLNPDAFLLVEAGALDRSSGLRKTAEAAPEAASLSIYEDEAGDVARLAREGLAADGVQLAPDAMELFISRLPKERGVARQEIERLILFLGPGRKGAASAEELSDFLGVEPDASLFDAAVDAFGGRLREAHAGWRRAQAEGEGGPAVVRALGLHLIRLRRALVAVQGGKDATQAAKAAGVFWKQEREFLRQMRSWGLAELDLVQPELLEVDRACKSTGSPDHLLAERALMGVAARARRLGL